MRFGIAHKISGALALAMGMLALTLWFGFDRFTLFQSHFEQIANQRLRDLLAVSELERGTTRLLALAPDVLHPRGEYLFSSVKELVQTAAAEALALTDRLEAGGGEGGEAPETARLAARYRYLADNLLLLVALGEEQQSLRVRMERLYRRLGILQLELVEQDAGAGAGAGWRISMLRPIARLFAVRESTHGELIRREGEAFAIEIEAAGGALGTLPESLRETAGLIHAEVRGYGGNGGLFLLRSRDADLEREIARRLDDGRLAIGALMESTRALHQRASRAALEEAAAIRRGLEQIGLSLLLLAGFGLIVFGAIHLFVRRSVIHRLLELQGAIHANVIGPPVPAPVRGSDELALMAREVNYFIDEIGHREAALKSAAKAAEEANRAKGEFLANISHEIRTPMNAILNLTALSLKGVLEARERGLLEKVERSSAFLLALINELLDFSRIESGRLELEEVPFQLGELADGLEIYAEEARLKGLSFRIQVAEGTPAGVLGDSLRIQQVLRNLVGNAIKFTQEGRVEVAIAPVQPAAAGPEAGADAVWLEFVVRDSGIGVAPEKLEHIFEPFSQADSSTTRLFGGTGLGLAISRRLAERMGGELSVQSTLGVGSLFRLRLPLRRVEEGRTLARRRQQMREFPAERLAPLKGRLILLVEDNEFNQVVATELLERAGMEIDLAVDGTEAVEMAAREDYELILMDLQMPRMDGYEATRLIRGLGARGGLPIIALTANALPDTLSRCRAAGMDDLVAKPVAPALLYERLLHWLAGEEAEVDSDTAAGVAGAAMAEDAEMLALFARHYRDTAARLQEARGEGDANAPRRVFHNLKSAAGSIGAGRLQQLAAEVEQRLLEGGEWPEGLAGETLAELGRVLERMP